MYEAIKFDLSGKNASFRKPDVNVKVYFTYNNIHKIALLGILGAIIGLKGWRNYVLFQEEEPEYPEFYSELKNISVSIIPVTPKGYFPKKIQYFNNSVGYASKEQGGNLQVYEQWLENPKWTIFLKNDGVRQELWEQLSENLLNGKTTYIPYLGKNEFPANIDNVKIVEIKPEKRHFIDSLYIGNLDSLQDDETKDNRSPYIFTEYLPTELIAKHCFYAYSRAIYTNCKVQEELETFTHGETVLSFI